MFCKRHCLALWRRKLENRERSQRRLEWTAIQVYRYLLRNHFDDMKKYARISKLKRNAPAIYDHNLERKAFRMLKLLAMKAIKYRAIVNYVDGRRVKKLTRAYLKKWIRAYEASQSFAMRWADFQLLKVGRIFLTWQHVAAKKKEERSRKAQQLAAFTLAKKRRALANF